MDTIHISGRRWFRKSAGNTYNSVRIYINGKQAAYLPCAYGYGDFYLQRAHEWLGANVYPELAKRHENGSPMHCTTIWLRENGGTYECVDVPRKADL